MTLASIQYYIMPRSGNLGPIRKPWRPCLLSFWIAPRLFSMLPVLPATPGPSASAAESNGKGRARERVGRPRRTKMQRRRRRTTKTESNRRRKTAKQAAKQVHWQNKAYSICRIDPSIDLQLQIRAAEAMKSAADMVLECKSWASTLKETLGAKSTSIAIILLVALIFIYTV